ncbi:methionyl-tRNA formyltransferase [Xanthobacter dioxanivorans]|uniref:Methionyl-tRNA formyltransferase n=1 Tax=Xanthobacter dioxanivorans TaxID=2528964 RepID=A0A974PTQ2_9HYPH|nr:methionyl-tRNA formyltransferase [Xanthobacter dioxanivorans]QRG09587.1 methionyl-tRNA formyltransferase [Xanthobacter dioxanivorans]
MRMRIVFMGTPDFAVPTLSEIVGRGHDVAAVYTRAPAPAGRRGLDLTPSPVHQVAERFGLKVLTPRSLRGEEAAAEFRGHGADVAVVVAYGLILPPAILQVPALGCLNLHGSLLPRWRGAAPIQRAIMAGDRETGVAVMQMEAGLDTGPVGLVERIPIGPDMTAGDLHDRMMVLGADLMARALAALERGGLGFTPQPEEGVVYAAKIEKGETRIDWSQPASAVHDRIRGLSPFPGAWFPLGPDEARVKVLRSTRAEGTGAPGEALDDRLTIACGSGAVRLLELQKAGKQPMGADAFLRGNSVPSGTRLP